MLQCAAIGAPGNSGQISRTLSQSVMTRSNRLSGEAGERLRRATGDVDTALGHDPHRVRVQRLRVAARAAGLDGARRSVFDERFGDLGAGAVAGAQEQQPRPCAAAARRRRGGAGASDEPGMEREPGFAEQVAAAEQIGPVVDVAAVGRASAGADDAGVPELRQVVGDEVLRLPDELHELADPAIAAPELDDQLPAQRIAEQPEDLRRRCRSHSRITSV